MSTLRPFSIYDMLKFNNVNLDILTETFSTSFYGEYVGTWNECNATIYNSTGMVEGYVLGKVEGAKNDETKKNWHGHVSAVTVAPYFRRQGLARYFMKFLEDVSEKLHNCFYVDLFVRSSNKIATGMYQHFGYNIYQTIENYYSSDGIQPSENAYDMRKSLARDKEHILDRPTGKTIKPEEIEFY
ncbi:MAG: GNAT family N-acetyltransferase [archaeon]|nr:GNAT family N-acetyltransferase [archaeon]